MNRRDLVDAYQEGRIDRDAFVEALVADGVDRGEAEGFARSLASGRDEREAAASAGDPPGDLHGPGGPAPRDVYGPGAAPQKGRVVRIWFLRLPRWAWLLVLIGIPLLVVVLLFVLCPRGPEELTEADGGPQEEKVGPIVVLCVGTYHRPLGDDPSFDRLGVRSNLPAATLIEAEHDGEERSEPLGPDGLVLFDFGISEFGDHTYAIFAGGRRIERGTLEVGPEERTCDQRTLERLFREERAARQGAQVEEPETPQVFARALAGAIRLGDDGFLLDRLHPEVIELYGEDQCRAHVRGIRDPTLRFRVLRSTGPAPWEWMSDGRSVPIEDVFTVVVLRTVDGESGRQEAHFALVGLRLHWFTDCGDPL